MIFYEQNQLPISFGSVLPCNKILWVRNSNSNLLNIQDLYHDPFVLGCDASVVALGVLQITLGRLFNSNTRT